MRSGKSVLLVAAMMIALQGCSSGKDEVVTGKADKDLAELIEMVQADQAIRADEDIDPRIEYATDQAHRKRVFELLAEGKIVTAGDRYNAALILQHTPVSMCGESLISESRENYLLAHCLARSAAGMNHGPARRMAAMTLDRYLWYSGLPQKYGTNYRIDEETGKRILEPLDPHTTDEERARWDVEPLSVLKGELE